MKEFANFPISPPSNSTCSSSFFLRTKMLAGLRAFLNVEVLETRQRNFLILIRTSADTFCQGTNETMPSKPCRGGEMCGEEQPCEEIFWIYPRCGRVGEKKVKIFLAGPGLARKKSKFYLLGPVLSRQNVQIPCQNEPIPHHGCPGEVKSGFQTQGILAGPRPSRQRLSREKTPGLAFIRSLALDLQL